MSKRFLVFQSKTHRYLRCTVIALTFFLFALSYRLGFTWLYAVSVLFFLIAVLFLGLLYAYVTVSSSGIRLQYGFFRRYSLQWEEILCCGTFSLRILGAEREEEYIYFSKRPVSYPSLVAGKTLPAQSDTFLFMTKQNKVLPLIKQYFPRFKE